MPAPRNPPVPRFAPQNSITLITALDIYGRAVDPTWTGEEVKADTPHPNHQTGTSPISLLRGSRAKRLITPVVKLGRKTRPSAKSWLLSTNVEEASKLGLWSYEAVDTNYYQLCNTFRIRG